MGDIEYLEKKVEALETLYQAEKERASEIQRSYAGLEQRLNQLRDDFAKLCNHFKNTPYFGYPY